MKIEATDRTPFVNLNLDGEITLRGRSIAEDPISFYAPIMEWTKKYVKTTVNSTIINFDLEYFNTTSSKCLLDLFKAISILKERVVVKVNWLYNEEDEDMLELAEEFSYLLGMKFNIIKK